MAATKAAHQRLHGRQAASEHGGQLAQSRTNAASVLNMRAACTFTRIPVLALEGVCVCVCVFAWRISRRFYVMLRGAMCIKSGLRQCANPARKDALSTQACASASGRSTRSDCNRVTDGISTALEWDAHVCMSESPPASCPKFSLMVLR